MAEPGTGAACCDRNSADGLATPLSPRSVMANTPSSLAAPKRFLIARTSRKLECVSLRIEDGVDHVLEHARAGDGAFLGHVADENDDDVPLLGEPRQLRRALADLRDAARRRSQRLRVGGLDRVDDDDLGRLLADGSDDRLELDLGQQRHRRVRAEALGAQRDLLDRFSPVT
jgi:hypothetical protein